jgi:F-type H+-transporting ATPase subunit b
MQVLNFAILVLVMDWLLYRPLRNVMYRRREGMRQTAERVADLESTLEQQAQEYRRQLAEATLQAQAERAQVVAAAAAEREALLAAAQQEAVTHSAEIRTQVERQRQAVAGQLVTETRRIARQLAGRILGRPL